MFKICVNDIRVSFRTSGVIIALAPVLCCIVLIIFMKKSVGVNEELFTLMVETTFTFMSSAVMLICGMMISEISLLADRENRIIQVLISSGIGVEKVLFARIIASVCVGYVAIIIPYIGIMGYYFLTFEKVAALSGMFYFKYFLLYPFITIVMVELFSLLQMIIKNGTFLMGFLPYIVIFLLIYLNMLEMEGKIKIDAVWLVLTTVAAVVVGTVVTFLIKRIPKEYIVNLDA
ncbi:MAG: hypothetical protein K6F92_00880 [Lachnospiraceae bacterium]|nr:hypothetical protein [Lachnospiraceae bacterium]